MPRVKKEVNDTPSKRKSKKQEFHNEMYGKMFPVNKDAKQFEVDNLIYQPIDDKTCKVIGYKTKSKIKLKLVIPDTVKKYKVVSIGFHAFPEFEKLKEVVLPNGLIEICPRAFSWCEQLSKINIPSTLKYIGYWAFENCYRLFHSETIFDMPDSLEVIGMSAFDECHDIKKIIIGRNLKYIGNGGFSGNDNLEFVSFERNRTVRFGKGVFYNCNLLKTTSKIHDMSTI